MHCADAGPQLVSQQTFKPAHPAVGSAASSSPVTRPSLLIATWPAPLPAPAAPAPRVMPPLFAAACDLRASLRALRPAAALLAAAAALFEPPRSPAAACGAGREAPPRDAAVVAAAVRGVLWPEGPVSRSLLSVLCSAPACCSISSRRGDASNTQKQTARHTQVKRRVEPRRPQHSTQSSA